MGTPIEFGGSGDPSPSTALGVFCGIKASMKHIHGSDDLAGSRVAVQGLGNVGWNLCRQLSDAGAKLIVADIMTERARRGALELGADVAGVDDIYDVDADVFAPCALGAVLNDDTLPKLRCKIVAGGANNQLKTHAHGEQLHDRGVLYAPDFVVNAGGVIQFAFEHAALSGRTPYDPAPVASKVQGIYHSLLEIYRMSEADGISTSIAANRLAEQILGSAAHSAQ